ncbi:MAG: NPCBM/NEW2 domain-containing protein [Bacteroidales bacterium]
MNTKIVYPLISLFVLLSFISCTEKYSVWIDNLPLGEIIDPYGPPKKNASFAGEKMSVTGRVFDRGLGTHAPSELTIELDGKGKTFEAWVGVDDYTMNYLSKSTRDSIDGIANYSYFNQADHYDFSAGGTVIFKIFLDGKEIFSTDLISSGSSPKFLKVNVRNGKTLSLVVETAGDGAYRDFANWMNAKLTVTDSTFSRTIYHHQDELMVNPVGYLTKGVKTCIKHNDGEFNYQIVDSTSGIVAYEGIFVKKGGDFGNYLTGDFSEFERPGIYYIVSGKKKSKPFILSNTTYVEPLRKHLNYITMQRSGHPEKGWISRSHLDDGVRDDNGKHQDVTGGWFDANDLRKPARGNTNLLYALASVLEKNSGMLDQDKLIEEIQWGNKFLFAMQEPEGYLMDYVGSTWDGYADNRWTDNIPGNEDDRTIITKPADLDVQLFFIISQFKIYNMLKDKNPKYARECLRRAVQCYNWVKLGEAKLPGELALAISAHVYADKSAGAETAGRFARESVRKLLNYFTNDSISGLYYINNERHRVLFQSFGDIFSGFADFMETYPNDPLYDEIYSVVEQYSAKYITLFKEKNAFSILPWILLKEVNTDDRAIQNRGYKYFLHVGMNQQLARNGFGLLKLNRYMNMEEWYSIAQSHLNWIYGVNPYYASTVTGIGYNQPDLFKTGAEEFTPPTPEIVGGVMTGIGGTQDDRICLYPGWWWTTEYWSPTVMSSILLVNELQDYYNQN